MKINLGTVNIDQAAVAETQGVAMRDVRALVVSTAERAVMALESVKEEPVGSSEDWDAWAEDEMGDGAKPEAPSEPEDDDLRSRWVTPSAPEPKDDFEDLL